MKLPSRYLLTSLWLLSLLGSFWFLSSFFLAKQALSTFSKCNEATTLLQQMLKLHDDEIHYLQTSGLLADTQQRTRNGCWMDRTVDSILFIIVDALRFDFALYDLPKSVGQHLSDQSRQQSRRSSLYHFIADPPTVTVQRLKALTTGGLPTFADFSTNFGGADVHEDSWINQIKTSSFSSRGLSFQPRLAFVGDDTWKDLYPNLFDIELPYPSFNTRDLDTVDNGCLKHIPSLLPSVRSASRSAKSDDIEVLVVHFLGVDHVGHTYGPFNQHMTRKLNQMDDALTEILSQVDKETESCRMAMIMGDHGMTPDGNHGGGTFEEINAALFVHTSPACKYDTFSNTTATTNDKSDSTSWMHDAFTSIHQIDLVSTLSLLLGLPIPFANVGILMTDLFPPSQRATALALNAAQLWRYFVEYSESAHKLPGLPSLQSQLDLAAGVYRQAITQARATDNNAHELFSEASIHFKSFGEQAFLLAQHVWTQFDTVGMTLGIVILLGATLFLSLPLFSTSWRLSTHTWEISVAIVFAAYHNVLLSFSNSYIYEEETSMNYSLAILSLLIARRLYHTGTNRLWRGVLLIPVATRCNMLFVSGHGLDPSLRLHMVHHPVIFLSLLATLASFRYEVYRQQITQFAFDACSDIVAILFLAISWLQKSSTDPQLKGYFFSQLAIITVLAGLGMFILRLLISKKRHGKVVETTGNTTFALLSKLFLGLLIVTGPSSSPSLILYIFQIICVYSLAMQLDISIDGVSSLVIAVLWKLIVRSNFFATNHAFAFNKLQFSAAFVATEEFNFVLSGIALFLNTFGWEISGLIIAWHTSRKSGRKNLWRWYGVLQLLELTASCISVSALRRHLMVWDIYAPHLIFVACFTVLHIIAQVFVAILDI